MSFINQPPEFSFDLFYSSVNAYYRTAAIKAAIELGVFDVVGEGNKTLQEIATECKASDRGIRILCYFLVSIGFLKMQDDQFYMTRDMTMILSRKYPGYLGGSIDFLLSPYIMDAFKDLASVVRTGNINLSEKGGVNAPDHPQWVTFAKAMGSMMSLPSMLLADLVDTHPCRPIKVLDLAGGHGLFGIAVAERNPNAKVTCIDWANVLEVAKENAIQANVHDRIEFRAGNAFEIDYGNDYDVILLTNFLHHFDMEGCEKILAKAKESLNEYGRAFVFEFISNEDRVSPSLASTFSMMMLGTTPSGEVYSFSDMKKMFMNTGYSHVELKPIPPAMERVVVSYKNIDSFNSLNQYSKTGIPVGA
jgi:2-polyprenyl-3-methyl-5-hydroxy-6-metoxy-1,4-benzoquinol methylase